MIMEVFSLIICAINWTLFFNQYLDMYDIYE